MVRQTTALGGEIVLRVGWQARPQERRPAIRGDARLEETNATAILAKCIPPRGANEHSQIG